MSSTDEKVETKEPADSSTPAPGRDSTSRSGQRRPPRNANKRRQSFLGWLGQVLGYYLTAPFRAFSRRPAPRAAAPKVSLLTRITRTIFYPFYALAFGVSQFFVLLSWWFNATSTKYLLQGLPAIAAATIVGSISAVAYLRPVASIANRYQTVAKTSLTEANIAERAFATSKSVNDETQAINSYRKARVCYERLGIIEGKKDELRYKLVEAEEGIGRLESAKEEKEYFPNSRVLQIIEELSPEGKPGYSAAHLWKAERLFSPPDTPEKAKAFERHLRFALINGTEEEKLRAHSKLAEYYIKNKRFEEAIENFKYIIDRRPDLRLIYATVLKEQNELEKSRLEAEICRNTYRRELNENGYADLTRINLTDSLALLDDYKEAEKVALEGFKLSANSELFRQVLSKLYSRWLAFLRKAEPVDWASLLGVAQNTLRADPINRDALQILVELSQENTKQGELSKQVIEQLLASGEAPAMLHVVLGMDAFTRGEFQSSKQHLEIALKLDRGMADVVNNLAWLYANTEPKDLEKAFRLANTAVTQQPTVPAYRDTRGQILVLMGRYLDGVADLESVLPMMRADPFLHASLAEAYNKLDMPDLATQHKAISDEISARMEANGGTMTPRTLKKEAEASKTPTASKPAVDKPTAINATPTLTPKTGQGKPTEPATKKPSDKKDAVSKPATKAS